MELVAFKVSSIVTSKISRIFITLIKIRYLFFLYSFITAKFCEFTEFRIEVVNWSRIFNLIISVLTVF